MGTAVSFSRLDFVTTPSESSADTRSSGKVTFQYRDPARPIRNLISRLAAQKWIDQVSDLDLIVGATQLPKRLGYDVDQTIVDNLSTVAKAYRNLVTALRQLTVKCNIALGADIDNPGPLSPLSGDAAVLVKKVVGDLSKLTAATIPPSAAGNTTAVFNSTISVLSDYIDGTATPSDVSKQAQLVVPLIQLNTDVSSTELAQAVQALDEEVRASVSMYISNRATASIGQANPGEYESEAVTSGLMSVSQVKAAQAVMAAPMGLREHLEL